MRALLAFFLPFSHAFFDSFDLVSFGTSGFCFYVPVLMETEHCTHFFAAGFGRCDDGYDSNWAGGCQREDSSPPPPPPSPPPPTPPPSEEPSSGDSSSGDSDDSSSGDISSGA